MVSRCLSADGVRFWGRPVPAGGSASLTVGPLPGRQSPTGLPRSARGRWARPEGVGTGLDTSLEAHRLTHPCDLVSHLITPVMLALVCLCLEIISRPDAVRQ